MFEADLPNVDSLYNTKFIRFAMGIALASKSNTLASRRQCRQEWPAMRFKNKASMEDTSCSYT